MILIFAASVAFPASEEQKGTLGFQTMRISMGARSAAMGEAYVSVADDISALSANPAGLASLESPQLMASHYEWFGGIRYEWLGFAQPIAGVVTGAISISHLHTPDTIRTVESQSGAWGYAQDGTFRYTDTVVQVGIGATPMANLQAGLAIKMLRGAVSFQNTSQNIPDYQNSGTVLSLGIMYDTPLPNLTVGMSYRDIELSSQDYTSAESSIGKTIGIGGSYHLKFIDRSRPTEEGAPAENVLLLSGEVEMPPDNATILKTGIEYRMNNGFSLRMGYRTDPDFSGLNRLSAGLGYRSGNYNLDYAFVSRGDLGDIHRISLTLEF